MPAHAIPDPKVAYRIRLHISLYDYIQQLAEKRDLSVTKLTASMIEERIAEIKQVRSYSLHPMTEVYSLSRNPTMKVGTTPMNIYMRQSDNNKVEKLAAYHNCSIPAMRNSLILDMLERNEII